MIRGRFVLIATLAPALAGCGGLSLPGLETAPQAGLGPPPAMVGSAPTPPPAMAGSAPPTGAVSTPLTPASAPAPQAPAAVIGAAPVPPPAPPIPTGAALGGALGGPIGAQLSEADRTAAWNAQLAALDSGQRKSWRGGRGVFGFVEPGAETGSGCRAYSQTIYVAGRPNRGQGVACKEPAGGWRMTS